MKKVSVLAVFAALAASAAAMARGPEWVETGDAGSLPGTAQVVTSSPTGQIKRISGSLQGFGGSLAGDGDFVDMYCVCVYDPKIFCIVTSQGTQGSATFDTQLWVFDSKGRAVMGNDDASPNDTGSAIFQFATDGTEAGIYEPGFYYICISGKGVTPFGDGGSLYSFANPTEVSGPDGQGGGSPVAGWGTDGPTGEYTIAMNGVCPVPAPGGLAMMLGAFVIRARRRR